MIPDWYLSRVSVNLCRQVLHLTWKVQQSSGFSRTVRAIFLLVGCKIKKGSFFCNLIGVILKLTISFMSVTQDDTTWPADGARTEIFNVHMEAWWFLFVCVLFFWIVLFFFFKKMQSLMNGKECLQRAEGHIVIIMLHINSIENNAALQPCMPQKTDPFIISHKSKVFKRNNVYQYKTGW